MARSFHRGSGERESGFIARTNAAKRFIQTVGIFALCVTVAVVSTVTDMPGLVALMAGVSVLSGPLAFLWFIERGDRLTIPARVPRVLRSVVGTGVVLILAIALAIVVSLTYGAWAGMAATLLAFGAEFAAAVSIRYRELLNVPGAA